jgi:hypothetical protein
MGLEEGILGKVRFIFFNDHSRPKLPIGAMKLDWILGPKRAKQPVLNCALIDSLVLLSTIVGLGPEVVFLVGAHEELSSQDSFYLKNVQAGSIFLHHEIGSTLPRNLIVRYITTTIILRRKLL